MLCKSRKCTNMRKASQVTEISLDLTDVDIFSQLSNIGLLFQTDSVLENCHISRCLQVHFHCSRSLVQIVVWCLGCLFVEKYTKQPNKSEHTECLYVLKNYLSITWPDGGNILVV